jgi:ribosome maturation factor RimP
MRYADEAGRRKYVGRLKGAQDGAAIVEVEGRAVSLKLDEVERAKLVPAV